MKTREGPCSSIPSCISRAADSDRRISRKEGEGDAGDQAAEGEKNILVCILLASPISLFPSILFLPFSVGKISVYVCTGYFKTAPGGVCVKGCFETRRAIIGILFLARINYVEECLSLLFFMLLLLSKAIESEGGAKVVQLADSWN